MNKKDITIILATSIIPAHPNTKMIDETIRSMRVHFPDNEIIMQIDGLRKEQKQRKPDYDEYKNRILWKLRKELTQEFGKDLWEKSLERQRGKGTLENLYYWYKKQVKEATTKSEIDIQFKRANTRGLSHLF
jgi:hypothetical protein